jgi:nitroreductase
MGLLKEIELRRSYRSFTEKIPDNEDIKHVFEAARLAPSSSNAQAWKYYFAKRGSSGFKKIANSLAEGNKVWAENAALLIVSTAAKYLSSGKPYKHAWHDVGLANAQLGLQAEHLGLFTHIMGGFSAEIILKSLSIDSEKEDIVCVIALGYHGDLHQLPEVLQAREMADRVRKPSQEVFFEID